jgi:hypothetical protein
MMVVFACGQMIDCNWLPFVTKFHHIQSIPEFRCRLLLVKAAFALIRLEIAASQNDVPRTFTNRHNGGSRVDHPKSRDRCQNPQLTTPLK